MVRKIDLRNNKDLECGKSKLETLNTVILNYTEPGEVVELIVGSADTWYALKKLGEDLGYEVISEDKLDEKTYTITIRIDL